MDLLNREMLHLRRPWQISLYQLKNMHLTENQLFEIAQNFRDAICRTDFSREAVGEEGHLRMENFPMGTCAEVSTLLGIYLVRKYDLDPLVEYIAQIEEEEAWYGTHNWLEHDGIPIDITADQFQIEDNPVIVSRNSRFHQRFAKKRHPLSPTFGFEHQPDWMIVLYSAIIQTLHASPAD